LDDRVQRTLVDNLYARPGSLTAGAANGIIAALVAAAYSGNPLIWRFAMLLSLIGVTRVVLALALPRLKLRDTKRLELVYETGAFSYTAVVGIFTALTIWYQIPMIAQMLMACYAIGYAGGMASRNAGRPLISVTGMLLTFSPICIALWQTGDAAARTLAAAIVICFAGMVSISLQIFRTLRDSISAAETSARLAEKMQHLARTDSVTGLHNRAGLNHSLVEHLSRARSAPKLALFWCDLDRFKEVNDVLGHQVGDRVLTEVASACAARPRATP
jgi:NADH:ubiquinone oxidoreductase subunit K